MEKSYIFTRAELRKIVPDMTAEQEDKIVELYLDAAGRFKAQIAALTQEKADLVESVRKAISS